MKRFLLATVNLVYLIIVLAMIAVPAFAQDATLEPVATVEAAPVTVITAEDGGTVNVTPETPVEDSDVSPVAVVLGLITTYFAGVVSTLAGVAVFVRGIMANPLWLGLAEKIGGTVATKEVGASAKGSLTAIAEFIEEATDDIPADKKPKVSNIVYADGTVYDTKTGFFTHPDGSVTHDLVHRPATVVNTANLPSSSTLTSPVGYEARPPAPPDIHTPQG